MHRMERIDRLLAGMGYGSRREVESLMDRDRILLDGQPILDCAMKVETTQTLCARLTVDGEPLDPLPGMVIAMHKPLGTTCSHKESGALIYDLLPARWRRRNPQISSVGRLDKDTSGLLLLTDDGKLLHRIISPKSHIAKRYLATLAQPLAADAVALFASGTLQLEGDDTPLLPARLDILTPTQARVTVHEGRYHQVRRMFAAIHNRVVVLHRESIGGLSLPEALSAGTFRLLTADEVQQIFTTPTSA
jgi:16S rRNA pseudouridine516 synthase